jgi:histidinol-phosphate aminotransferase
MRKAQNIDCRPTDKSLAQEHALASLDSPSSMAPVAAAPDVAARVATTIRADVRAMRAYAVAKAEGMIKLDAMENPYRLPESVRAKLAAVLADTPVNRYPDGGADAVKAALVRTLGLPDGVALVLGNGSDELLQMITTAVAAPGAAVLAPEPTFEMYRIYAQLAHLRYVTVALRDDFALDVEAMEAAIARDKPALVWLACPNNPTGNLFDETDVLRIVRATPGLVVIDEAYYAFAERTFLPRVLQFPNVVVVRTVSKIGMAGIRLGLAVGHPAWIGEIDKVRSPYNLNAFTQAAAPVLLAEQELLSNQAGAIRTERARLVSALTALPGVTAFPAQTNFVLARVPDADRWFAALRDAGILVKNRHGVHPLLSQCLRITVGTPAENGALIAALQTLAAC